jgi:hypothetical protein
MFTNLYATGNRTVRGLEALTLCILLPGKVSSKEMTIKINSQQEMFSNQKDMM